MQELDLHYMWFQQGGATCHITRVINDLLRDEVGENFISRSGPTNWPPRLCDLTSLDYFLWGYVKANVYTDKLAAIDALEDNIEDNICELTAEMLERVCPNWTKRMQHLKHSRAFHEIIFKHEIICSVLSTEI